jgi:hypothetical protein
MRTLTATPTQKCPKRQQPPPFLDDGTDPNIPVLVHTEVVSLFQSFHRFNFNNQTNHLIVVANNNIATHQKENTPLHGIPLASVNENSRLFWADR